MQFNHGVHILQRTSKFFNKFKEEPQKLIEELRELTYEDKLRAHNLTILSLKGIRGDVIHAGI